LPDSERLEPGAPIRPADGAIMKAYRLLYNPHTRTYRVQMRPRGWPFWLLCWEGTADGGQAPAEFHSRIVAEGYIEAREREDERRRWRRRQCWRPVKSTAVSGFLKT